MTGIRSPGQGEYSELASEITHELVVTYGVELVELIDNEKFLASQNLIIPREAHGFLDKEGVLVYEKMKKVVSLMHLMAGNDRDALSKAMAAIGSVSKDPARAVSLMARVWKYFESGKSGKADVEMPMEPGEVFMLVEDTFKSKGIALPSYDDVRLITICLDRWKKGGDPKGIMADVQVQIKAAIAGPKAEPDEDAIAKLLRASRGTDNPRVNRMKTIQAFLAKTMGVSANGA